MKTHVHFLDPKAAKPRPLCALEVGPLDRYYSESGEEAVTCENCLLADRAVTAYALGLVHAALGPSSQNDVLVEGASVPVASHANAFLTIRVQGHTLRLTLERVRFVGRRS